MNDDIRLKNHEIAVYYDKHGVLNELDDEEIEISLEGHLQKEILSGKRKRKLKKVSVTMDLYQIIAIKKIATIKSIPYQTLIWHWLSQNIKKELSI